MTSLGLHIGLQSLLSAQAALETVGHNISNATTPGYSRQSLHLSAAPAQILRGLALGAGVRADVVLRTTDALLGKRLIGQVSSIAQLDARLSGMGEVEALLGEPGQGGLGSLIQNFFTSFGSLAATPADLVLRAGAVESSQSMAVRFQGLASHLDTLKRDTAASIRVQTEEVNLLARAIVDLNREIRSFESHGAPANDLRDQRDEALKALGGLVDVTWHEGQDGSVTVHTNGALLVTPSRAYAVSATVDAQGQATLAVEGHAHPLTVKGGSIGGLIRIAEDFIPGLDAKLDLLAHELIRGINRAHSTGIPPSGSFHELTGANAIVDQDGGGDLTDELLGEAGLPFEVEAGALFVRVTDESSGSLTTTRIDIDPAETTVGDLLDALNAIPHIGASLDGSGRMQIRSDQGFGFDFSARLDPHPAAAGTFGGAAASLGSGGDGPFALANGDTLVVAGPSGPLTITFAASDFADISQATASEVAAAINADPATQASGMRAVVTGERLVLQSLAAGTSASFTLTAGSALGAFGWTAGTSVQGQTNAVDVEIGGAFTGAANTQFTFVPAGDGTIGTTSGLSVLVFDAGGNQVATLDVGAGYRPGTVLAVADGIEVSFGFGTLSATDNDAFAVDVLADSDSADVLVALGLNSLFTGEAAADIAVRSDLADDPSLLASSNTGAEGDNGALLALLDTQQSEIAGLGGADVGGFYGDVVSGIGFEIEAARAARDVDQLLFDSLKAQREQISGVNVDEELVDMLRFEQAFGAASRYIQVINSTNEEILNLL